MVPFPFYPFLFKRPFKCWVLNPLGLLLRAAQNGCLVARVPFKRSLSFPLISPKYPNSKISALLAFQVRGNVFAAFGVRGIFWCVSCCLASWTLAGLGISVYDALMTALRKNDKTIETSRNADDTRRRIHVYIYI